MISREWSNQYKNTSFVNAYLVKNTPVGLPDRGFPARGRLRKTTLKAIFEGSLRCTRPHRDIIGFLIPGSNTHLNSHNLAEKVSKMVQFSLACKKRCPSVQVLVFSPVILDNMTLSLS